MLLRVENLKKHYELRRLLRHLGTVKALDSISFSLEEKETLAVVGESGCGKSTLARLLTQIEAPSSGEILLSEKPLKDFSTVQSRRLIQMIFQDPLGSLNPRKKAWQIISEPLQINTSLSAKQCRKKAEEMMTIVGLQSVSSGRYPHMFSGGQRQRIGIARALILKPKILICDEPVSALDVSVQAQILNLLLDLQDELGLSYIFISHDLSVVRHIADKVLVIYLGKVVEYGLNEQIFSDPKHPYTQALIASTPRIDFHNVKKPMQAQGELPSPLNPPPGCAYHKRCPVKLDICEVEEPLLQLIGDRDISCHRVSEFLSMENSAEAEFLPHNL